MEQIQEGLEEKIQSMLEARRRFAVVENLALAFLYCAFGIFLTAFVWLLIDIFVAIPFSADPKRLQMGSGPINVAAFFIFALLVFWKRKKMVEEEYAGAGDFIAADSVASAARSLDELAGSILVAGPRFFVLATRCVSAARKIRAIPLARLIWPIAIAVQRRRKIRAADLEGFDMGWLLENIDWVPGVVRLVRKPAGFTVTEEFAHEALGRSAPEPDWSERQTESEPEAERDPIDQELRWALMVLGLERKATRAQVNAAYRKFAKLVHPDLVADPATRQQREEQMKDLNLAYEILRRRTT